MDILPDIEERRRAVTTFDRNVVVTAGAGTGKTTLLVDRIIHLLMREPSPLEITDIVALTFTNKAANEMKIRLKKGLQELLSSITDSSLDQNCTSFRGEPILSDLLERYRNYGLRKDRIAERASEGIKNLEKAQIGTMHSFAGYILRLFPVEAGIDPGFKEDDGTEFEEHFEREWEEWLEIELTSPSIRREMWEAVLRQVDLEDLKSFSRELCRELIPISRFKEAENQREPGEEIRHWLEGQYRMFQSLLSKYTKSRKIERELRKGSEVIHGILTGRDVDLSIEDVSSGNTPKGWDPDDYREASRLIRTAKRLQSVDRGFFPLLLGLLLPSAERCRERFTASGNISFDGLLTLCRDLLKTNQKVRRELKRRYKAILVDEFQDTDPVQYEILLYLSEIQDGHERDWRKVRVAPGKVFIVGDPKQSIYAFRRADIEAYSRVVEMILSDGKGLRSDLTTSFRSHHSIIAVVNELFSTIIERREMLQPEYVPLVPYHGKRTILPVQGVEFRLVDGREGEEIDAASATRLEAEALGRWLREEILDRDISPRHIAVLFRKLTDVSEYLEVFRRYNVPYIIEGERHFYTTQEVIDFVNLLKTIDNPCDTLSLVGVLRSPLGGLSDREIAEMAKLSLLDYRIDNESLREKIRGVSRLEPLERFLSDLYGTLRWLHDEAGSKAPPEAISAIFETLPVLELAAASFHGEQAVANLQKIQKIAESVTHKGDLTLKRFVSILEERVETSKEEGESLLAEETVDAVRILSIHKAKGLEFPVVVLAGIHSASKGGENTVDILYDWSSNELGFKVDRLRNYGAVMLDERRIIRDEEEEKRLLYVAMTRAKEYLVLSGTIYRREKKGGFLSMIRKVIGETLGDRSVGEITIGEGKIRQVLIDPADCIPKFQERKRWGSDRGMGRHERRDGETGRSGSVDIESFGGLWESRNRRYDSVRKRNLFVTPSKIEEEMAGPSVARKGLLGGDEVRRERAILIGNIAHYILKQWDFSNDLSSYRSTIEEVCSRVVPKSFGDERDSIVDELDQIFKTFFTSPAYDELKRGIIIDREVPFTISREGGIMDGVIDLIYSIDGRLYVADYKTDKVTEGDIQGRIKEYALSGKVYMEAVRRCLKVEVSGFKLIFLRLGKSVDLRVM